MKGCIDNERLILFILLAVCCIISIIVVSFYNANQEKSYPGPPGCRPLTLYRLQIQRLQLRTGSQPIKPLRTIHDFFDIIHQSMDHF